MILNQHKASCRKGRVDAAGGVGQKQNFSPHQFHQPCRKHHIRDRIALIVMNPSLHAYHRHILYITEDKLALMSRNRRYGEILNFIIPDFSPHIHAVRIIPQPGAQNQRHPGLKGNPFFNAFVAFQNLLIYLIHSHSPVLSLILFLFPSIPCNLSCYRQCHISGCVPGRPVITAAYVFQPGCCIHGGSFLDKIAI